MIGEALAGAGAGAQVVAGIASYYQEQQALGADQAELDKIKAIWKNITPPDYKLDITDPPNLAYNIPEPAFDFSKLSPEQYQQIGKYKPELTPFVEEKAPELVQKTAAAKTGRQAQLDVLSGLQNVAKSGYDPLLEAKNQQAQRQAQQAAQSRSASVMQDAARRGQLSSPALLAAQIQSGSSDFDRLQQQQAADLQQAYQNKLSALASAGQAGSQISSQEFGESAKNTDIINQFNAANTDAYRKFLLDRATQGNDAQKYNLGVGQDIANKNVSAANTSAEQQQGRGDDLAVKQYQARLGIGGFNRAGEQLQYQDKTGQQDRNNDLLSRGYTDQISKANGQSGIATQQIGQNNAMASSQGRLYKGIADQIGGGAAAYGTYQANKKKGLYDDEEEA